MKPKKGDSSAEMDEPLKDPLQLAKELVLLIVEARTPDLSVKGRVEGPHCPVIRGRPAHKCNAEKAECLRASDYCYFAQQLWMNNIPLCLDTILFPDCSHGTEEALVTEGTVSKVAEENALLVERWTIVAGKKRQEDGLSSNLLQQAVRSYLHFSQISSWLFSVGGNLPGHLAYRIYAPGEESTLEFHCLPDTHQFPACQASGRHLMVSVQSLQRQPSVPLLMCSQDAVRARTSKTNFPAVHHDAERSPRGRTAKQTYSEDAGFLTMKRYHDAHFGVTTTRGGKFREEPSAMGDNTSHKRTREKKPKNVRSLQEQVSAKILSPEDLYRYEATSSYCSSAQEVYPMAAQASFSARPDTDKQPRQTLSQADISAKKAQNLARMKMSESGDASLISGDVICTAKTHMKTGNDFDDEDECAASLAQPRVNHSLQGRNTDIEEKMRRAFELSKGHSSVEPLHSRRDRQTVYAAVRWEEDIAGAGAERQTRVGRGVKKKDGEKDQRIEQMKKAYGTMGAGCGESDNDFHWQVRSADKKSKEANDIQSSIKRKKEAEYSKLCKSLGAQRSESDMGYDLLQQSQEHRAKKFASSGKNYVKNQEYDDSGKSVFATFPSKGKTATAKSVDFQDKFLAKKLDESDVRVSAKKKSSISQIEASEEEFIRKLSERLSLVTTPSEEVSTPQSLSARPKLVENLVDSAMELKFNSQSTYRSSLKKSPTTAGPDDILWPSSGVDMIQDKWSSVRPLKNDSNSMSMLTIDVSRSPDIFEDSDSTPTASPNQTPRPKTLAGDSLVRSVAEKSMKQNLQSLQSNHSTRSSTEEGSLKWTQPCDLIKQCENSGSPEKIGTSPGSQTAIDSHATSQMQHRTTGVGSASVGDGRLRSPLLGEASSDKPNDTASQSVQSGESEWSENGMNNSSRDTTAHPQNSFHSDTSEHHADLWKCDEKNSRQGNEIDAETEGHKVGSRRVFEQNLLPLVSYDADSDSFKKVEQSYSSQILHSPKVLFSSDIPSTSLTESRKCIDFGEDLESDFLKSKINDMVGPETIGKYMTNLAALTVSASNKDSEVDRETTAMVPTEVASMVSGGTFGQPKRWSERGQDDDLAGQLQNGFGGQWARGKEDLIFEGDFSDGEPALDDQSRISNGRTGNRKVSSDVSATDGEEERELLGFDCGTVSDSNKEDSDPNLQNIKFPDGKRSEHTKRQLTYGLDPTATNDISQASTYDQIYHRSVEDREPMLNSLAVNELLPGARDIVLKTPADTVTLQVSPSLSSSFSSSSSSTSSVYQRSNSLSPTGQAFISVTPITHGAITEEEQIPQAVSVSAHVDVANIAVQKHVPSTDSKHTGRSIIENISSQTISHNTGIPIEQEKASTGHSIKAVPSISSTKMFGKTNDEGVSFDSERRNDKCEFEDNVSETPAVMDSDSISGRSAFAKKSSDEAKDSKVHLKLKVGVESESMASFSSETVEESPAIPHANFSLLTSSSPPSSPPLSVQSPALPSAVAKVIETSAVSSQSLESHLPIMQHSPKAKCTCHNTNPSPVSLSGGPMPRPSPQDCLSQEKSSESIANGGPQLPSQYQPSNSFMGAQMQPFQNGFDLDLQKPTNIYTTQETINASTRDQPRVKGYTDAQSNLDASGQASTPSAYTQSNHSILPKETTIPSRQSAYSSVKSPSASIYSNENTLLLKHERSSPLKSAACDSDAIETSLFETGQSPSCLEPKPKKRRSPDHSPGNSSSYKVNSENSVFGMACSTSSQSTDLSHQHKFHASLSSSCDINNVLSEDQETASTGLDLVKSKDNNTECGFSFREATAHGNTAQIKDLKSEADHDSMFASGNQQVIKRLYSEGKNGTKSKEVTLDSTSNNAVPEVSLASHSQQVVQLSVGGNVQQQTCLPPGKSCDSIPSHQKSQKQCQILNEAHRDISSGDKFTKESERLKNHTTMQVEMQSVTNGSTVVLSEDGEDVEDAVDEEVSQKKTAVQNGVLHHGYSSAKIIQTRMESRGRFEVEDDSDEKLDDDNEDGNEDNDNDVVFYISEPKEEPAPAMPKSSLSASLQENKAPVQRSPAVRPSSLSAEVDLEIRSRLDGGVKAKGDPGTRSPPLHDDAPGWCSVPPHRTVSTPSCMDREPKGQNQRSPTKASVIQQLNCDTAGQLGLRKLAARSASMIFNSRTGLPTQSSPAPLKRKPGGKFDYDPSLLNTRAIKNAFSCSKLASNMSDKSDENEEERKRTLSTSAPASTNCLLGNFEESILNGRIDPVGTVDGFTAEIGASGSFCPKHLHLPVSAFFFALSDDNAPSPYLGHINLDNGNKKGYHIPKKGTVQVTLFNPNKTVVKMFVVMYDLSDMPPSSQTFIRQRTIYCPTDQNSTAPSYLRYLIHLRCASTRSGKIYLHTDIRLIFARHKLDIDAKTVPYELKSFTEGPRNPKYSPKK